MSISNHSETQTASANGYGLLSVFVQQVSDNSPSYTGGDVSDMKYSAIFYGPYIKAKDINDAVGKPLQSYLAGHRETFDQNFNFPVLPGDGDFVWVVKSTRVEQSVAGEHCRIYFDCEAEDVTQLTPGTGGWVEDGKNNNWSVKWQSYTVEPYAFCSNKLHEDMAYKDPAVTEDYVISGDAMREHILKFIETKDNGVLSGHRWYKDHKESKYLNYHEQLVCDKVVLGRRTLYHYPVVTHTTVQSKLLDSVSAVINDRTKFLHPVGLSVDYICERESNELSDMPFQFPEKYVFVKQGDDLTKEKVTNPPSVKFTRTETYWGVLSADINYYGHQEWNGLDNTLSVSRWKLGKI